MYYRYWFFLFLQFICFSANAQKSGFFFHKVLKEESLTQIAKHYRVEVDSIKSWNNLTNDFIFFSQLLEIPDSLALSEEHLIVRCQQEIDSLLGHKQSNQLWLDEWIEDARQKNFNVDMSNNSAIQIVFERAQRKRFLEDSISKANNEIDKEIQSLSEALSKYELIVNFKTSNFQEQIITSETNFSVIEDSTTTVKVVLGKERLKQPTEKPVDPSKRLAYSNSDTFNVIIIDDSKVLEPKTKNPKKTNEKLEIPEQNNDSIFTTINIKEVEVKSNKKVKYKFGDLVDKTSQDKAKFYVSRAKTEIDKENLKKAFAYIDKSLIINPSYLEAFMLKGDIYASMQYFDAALEQYYKAQQLDNSLPIIHYNIGICLNQLSRKKDALVAMSEAVRLDSTYLLAIYGRSAMLLDLKNYEKAIEDFDRILALNKFFYPAHKGKGITLLKTGSYEDAIIELNKVIPFDSEDPVVYYHRGMAFIYQDKLYEACVDFLKATQLGSDEAQKAMKKYCE